MKRSIVSLASIGVLAGLAFCETSVAYAEGDVVINAVIEMTCFPPPPPEGEDWGIGPMPPCLLPVDLDPWFVSPDPSGLAHMIVRDDDTARFNIRLNGLAEDLVITAWISYFFPPGPAPDPIFEPIGEGLPAIAGVSAPLAPTTAGFTEGIGPEPNSFTIIRGHDSDGAQLIVELNYNPMKAGQGPLRNTLVNTDQSLAPRGTDAEQQDCCPDGLPEPKPQPVGSSYLRLFDTETGYQLLDEDGVPELLRSPAPVAFLAIVVHIDDTTHGINPGIAILPIPDLPASTGDHFLLGMFDLREFHMD